jgi:hypothetical protein
MSQQELYLEYNRLLKDERFGVKSFYPVYKLKKDKLTIEYKVDKKGKHVIHAYNDNESFINTTKTWSYNGDNYKKIYKYEQYQETTKEYFKNGLLHRENKPAYVYETYKYRAIITIEEWYKDGMLHNEEGPAYVKTEDEMHDINDPYYYREKLYFLNNEEYKEEKKYDEYITEIKKQKLNDELYSYNIMCKDVCGIVSSYVY